MEQGFPFWMYSKLDHGLGIINAERVLLLLALKIILEYSNNSMDTFLHMYMSLSLKGKIKTKNSLVSTDYHEILYPLTLFSKISFVDTINSKSCMVPARTEWQISCYRKCLFPCSCPVLTVQMVDLFSLLPAILFFSTQDCDPLWSCMTQSAVGTLTELRGFQMCPNERERGFRNEELLWRLSAY